MAVTVTHPFVSAIADDPTAAGNGEVLPSHWNAAHTVANALDKTGDTMTGTLTSTLGTITADTPNWTGTATWNNAGVTFNGIVLNITKTAADSASKFLNLKVGGVDKFSIYADGVIENTTQDLAYSARFGNNSPVLLYQTYIAGTAAGDFYIRNSGWTNFFNLSADGSHVLALRWDNNAYTFRVYGAYTDSSNYVRAELAVTSTTATLAVQTAGTGADDIDLTLTPAGAGGVVVSNGFAQLAEMTAPGVGAANTARIYAEDNGSGKTRLMVQFASGAAQQIAIEP